MEIACFFPSGWRKIRINNNKYYLSTAKITQKLIYYPIEVRVLSPGQKGSIGIGLTELDKCSGNQQPGWFKGINIGR
jgi:phage gp36-like protein